MKSLKLIQVSKHSFPAVKIFIAYPAFSIHTSAEIYLLHLLVYYNVITHLLY